MAIFFNKVQRVNPRDPRSGERKWYPVLKSIGKVNEHDLAVMIADETTLNPKEAEMAIYQLEKVATRLLLDGHTVQLGDLGTFNLTIKATPEAEREKVTADNIKKVNLRFRISKTMRDALDKALFKPVESLAARRR